MAGKISRLSSRRHPISYEFSEDQTQAKVALNDPATASLSQDFILYVKDDKINDSAVICARNDFGE